MFVVPDECDSADCACDCTVLASVTDTDCVCNCADSLDSSICWCICRSSVQANMHPLCFNFHGQVSACLYRALWLMIFHVAAQCWCLLRWLWHWAWLWQSCAKRFGARLLALICYSCCVCLITQSCVLMVAGWMCIVYARLYDAISGIWLLWE